MQSRVLNNFNPNEKLNIFSNSYLITVQIKILKEMIASGQIGNIGGAHDITTGEITFYPETMNIGS